MVGQWTTNSEVKALCNWMARKGGNEGRRRDKGGDGVVKRWRRQKLCKDTGMKVLEFGKGERMSCRALSCLSGLCVIVIQANEKRREREVTFVFELHKQSPVHALKLPSSFCRICRFFFLYLFNCMGWLGDGWWMVKLPRACGEDKDLPTSTLELDSRE